jgi:hypothetical protein
MPRIRINGAMPLLLLYDHMVRTGTFLSLLFSALYCSKNMYMANQGLDENQVGEFSTLI